MTKPLLEAQGLGCLRNNSRLFSDLNFSLMPGEILQVTGHNGSGKTSLLRLLSGLLSLEHGKVLRDSDELLYIGHKLGIKLALTVRENLNEMAVLHQANFPVFPRLVRGIRQTLDPADKPQEDGEVLRGEERSAFERLGLLTLADRPCLYLSAGQKQRLALARLFFIKRKLWILDEPFVHLDQSHSDILMQAMNQHCSEGGAIVVATHRSFNFTAKQQTLCLS